MERLTKRDAADWISKHCKPMDDCTAMYCRNRLKDRLAAYEDTGLTPEEVLPKDKADEIALKLMRLANLESICSYTRLQELAEADKDGRLAVTRWIPVTERLPEDSVKECIIFVPRVPENIVGVGRYLGSGRWVIDGWYLTPEAVVYWMPLPVVRCKDCKHYEMGVCLKIYSDGNVHQDAWQRRKPVDFCSYGERKDGADAEG